MVVQHNLMAMNSNRMLGINSGSQAKSTEKLSSGYKINRAADDAAGLSISEKMRKQIRGLSQASLNASDGISCVQTAEGALNEVQDMLQRMNELAVKAANGTMSEDDRNYIQDEIDQLVDEIDRVSETTKFNETYLLKGDETTKVTKYNVTVEYDEPDVKFATAGAATAYIAGSTAQLTGASAGDYIEVVDGKLKYKEGVVLYTTGAGTATAGSQVVGTMISEASLGDYFKIDTPAFYDGTNTATAKKLSEADIQAYFDENGNMKKTFYYAESSGQSSASEVGSEYLASLNIKITKDSASYNDDLELSFQVGAETDTANKISVKMQAMSAEGLNIAQLRENGVTGKDSTNADKAVNIIETAIQKISTQRSALGAVQNRLEHTIANLDNVVENTTAAESQIRDTDMATEMVKYSNNNILMQAGQAMLAQANQANQGVLSLLG